MSYFIQALAVTDDPGERTMLKERAAEAASFAGHYAEAMRLLKEAAGEHRAAGDLLGAGRVTAEWAYVMLTDGQAVEAVDLLTPLLAEVDRLEDPAADPVIATIGAQLSRAHMLSGEHGLAIELADRTIAIAERLGATEITLDTLVTKGSSVATMREQEGTAILLGALRLATIHGLARTEYRARNNVMVRLAYVDAAAATELVAGGLELARRLGHRSTMQHFAVSTIQTAYYTGDWDGARREIAGLDRDDLPLTVDLELQWLLMELSAATADPVTLEAARARAEVDLGSISSVQQAVAHPLTQAMVDYAAGRFADGLARLAMMDSTALEEGERGMLAGRLAIRAGDVGAARQALAELSATSARSTFVGARAREIAAGIAALDGDEDAAVAGFGEAMATMTELGYRPEAGLMGIDFAATVGLDRPEAREAARFARNVFEPLGAKAYLAQLDALDGGAPVATTVDGSAAVEPVPTEDEADSIAATEGVAPGPAGG